MSRSFLKALLGAACAAILAACVATPNTATPLLPSLQTADPSGPQATASPGLPDPAGLAALPTAVSLAVDPSQRGPAVAGLAPDLVATVNDVPITRAAYEAQVAQAQAYFVQQPGFDPFDEAGRQALLRFRQNYLEVMIDQALIAQTATELGVEIDPATVEEEYALMRGDDHDAFAEWLRTSGLTPDALRAQLRADLTTRAVRDAVTASTPRLQPQVRVSHILLEDQSAADEATRRLNAGETFVDVARSLSADLSTRDSGGDLGYLPRGVMPPAFDDAAFSLAAGKRSDVIESEIGLQIVLVTEPAEDRPVPDRYWPAVQQHAFADWLQGQREAASILRADLGAGG